MIKISLFLRLKAKFLGCFTANGLPHCDSPIPIRLIKEKSPQSLSNGAEYLLDKTLYLCKHVCCVSCTSILKSNARVFNRDITIKRRSTMPTLSLIHPCVSLSTPSNS